tara:strand:- start:1056 stop:1604 length:549 start_codon:yes stop_codon:yes gene_type:complete
MRIIFLNGPPRCGKDYAATMLRGFNMKLSKRLKDMTHRAFGLVDLDGDVLPHDWFEHIKDLAIPEFHGATPRSAYIAMSEGFVKPLLGDDWLGKMLCVDIGNLGNAESTFLISDSGFRGEAEAIVKHFGPEVCTLVRIHREGHGFGMDSRGYILLSDLGVKCVDVANDGTSDFLEVLKDAIS